MPERLFPSQAHTPGPSGPPLHTHTVRPSGGQPLNRATRREMSARFGHDFSQIRIHTDAEAAESARSVGANAYTLGGDIVFGAGKYQPGSRETDRLLAHELTHVVQQARSGPGDPARLSRNEDASEQEADAVSQGVLAGRRVEVRATAQAAIARHPDDDAQMCSSDPASQVCVAPDPASQVSVAPAAPIRATPDPDRVATPDAGPADPVYPTYNQAAYGIVNQCAAPGDTVNALVGAAQQDLSARGVPPFPVNQLPARDTNLGSAYSGPNDWHFGVHDADFSTEDGHGGERPLEDRADAANTVAHESFHMYQGYEEARLVAGLGGDPTSVVPPSVAAQAAQNPILQSDAHTARVQEWYDDDFGSQRAHTQAVEADPDASHHEYCQLPVERDAWNVAQPVTDSFRQTAGVPMPSPAQDRALCE